MKRRSFLTLLAMIIALSMIATQCVQPAPIVVTQEEGKADAQEEASSGAEAEEGPIALKMMVQGTDEEEVFAALAEEFMAEHPNVTIEVQNVPAENWGNYFDKIATMVAGGTTIDMVRVASEGAQLLASLGIAQPLDKFLEQDPEFKEEFFSDVDDDLFEPFRYEGQLYGLPFEWNTCAIFYNTRIFEENGIDPPSGDWTVEEFLEIARKLTKDEDGDGINDVWGYQDSYFMFCTEPWIFNAGGSLLNEDWTASNATDPKTVEALAFMRDLIWEHKVTPTGAEVGFSGGPKPMFIAGKIGMMATGRWNVSAFANAGFTEWDVVPFPKWRDQVNIYGVGSTYLLKNSEQPDMAWEFIKFLASKEAISKIAEQGWSIPQRRSVAHDEEIMGLFPPDNYKFWYDVLDNARPVTAPPEFNKIDDIYSRYMELIVLNEMDIDEAIQKMDEELNEALDNE